MKIIQYKKLVRNKIPDIIKASGKTPITKTISGIEHEALLDMKLKEEVDEYYKAPQYEKAEELADILEVIDAIMARYGIEEDVREIKERKAKERGDFKTCVYLDSVEEE